MVANVEGAEVIFNVVFMITLVSLLIQGTTVSAAARALKLDMPLEESESDFGVEISEEIDTNLKDVVLTKELLKRGDTLKEMQLPKGTLVIMVKREDEYLVPNGTLKLMEGDKLLVMSKKGEETEEFEKK